MAAERKEATWSVAEAKAKFSEVIERAIHEGPQEITRNGKEVVVVVGKEEWLTKRSRPSVFETLQKAQLEDGELDLRRPSDPPRHIDL